MTPSKTLKTWLGCELSPQQIRYVMENSPERVLNTAIDINLKLKAQVKHPHGLTNLEDLEDIKPLVTMMWNAFRNELFVELQANGKS